MTKYEFTAELVRKFGRDVRSLLDVGCRDGVLRHHISVASYYGIDVDPNSACDALVDIERRTPFADQQFDLLVALDVAEHTDNIYAAVNEMLRVARVAIVALPNMYNFAARWRFLCGRPLNDKYRLDKRNAEAGGYRHRWLFTPAEANEFMRSVAVERGLTLDVNYYYPAGFLGRFVKWVAPDSVGSEAIYFVFRRPRTS